MKTMTIAVPSLVGTGYAIKGDAGGWSRITGEVYRSNLIQGTYAVETEHGTIYLDDEEMVEVTDDEYRLPSREDLIATARDLMEGNTEDPELEDPRSLLSEYVRAMSEVIAQSTVTYGEDADNVKADVHAAILAAKV